MSSKSLVITPQLSKDARAELTLTQKNVIEAAGIQAYKFKQFEATHYNLSDAELRKLQDFYESEGVDLEELAGRKKARHPREQAALNDRRGITQISRPGFRIAEHIDAEQVDRILARMEENEQRVSELIGQEYRTTLFGGQSEETSAAFRELFGLLAESHLLFRGLQGKTIVGEPKESPETIGDHLTNWAKDSPVYDALAISSSAQYADELED